VNLVLDGKRGGAKPKTIRAIIDSVFRQIPMVAVADYLCICAVDAGLLPDENSPGLMSAAAVLTFGCTWSRHSPELPGLLDDHDGFRGASLGLLQAADNLLPLASKRFTVDLKAAMGDGIVDALSGRETTVRLRAICKKYRIRLDDVLGEPGAGAWLEFIDVVRVAVFAVRPDIPPVERVKLEDRINTAGDLLVRRARKNQKRRRR
jgi:hypothetical protein